MFNNFQTISLDLCLPHFARCFTSVLTRGRSAAIMVNLTYVVLLGGRRGMLKKFSFAVERDRLSMRGKKRI